MPLQPLPPSLPVREQLQLPSLGSDGGGFAVFWVWGGRILCLFGLGFSRAFPVGVSFVARSVRFFLLILSYFFLHNGFFGSHFFWVS